MKITVQVQQGIDTERIRQVSPYGPYDCHVQFIDEDGQLVFGVVAAPAEIVRQLVDGAAAITYAAIQTEDAREQAARWSTTGDAYRACAGMD